MMWTKLKFLPLVLIAILMLAMVGPHLISRSSAQEPYFHRYKDIKQLYVGGIPEEDCAYYMTAILDAAFQTFSSGLSSVADRNDNLVNVESVDRDYSIIKRYSVEGEYYYSYKVEVWGTFTGNFLGSPIDPITLAALVVVLKAVISAIATVVTIVIVAGLITQWLTDITTETYHKVWYDEEGNIIAEEEGQKPSFQLTLWLAIASISVTAIALFYIYTKFGKQKGKRK